jgi:divalent metal cation (Fe/Co/Zn/Cd) transporter
VREPSLYAEEVTRLVAALLEVVGMGYFGIIMTTTSLAISATHPRTVWLTAGENVFAVLIQEWDGRMQHHFIERICGI